MVVPHGMLTSCALDVFFLHIHNRGGSQIYYNGNGNASTLCNSKEDHNPDVPGTDAAQCYGARFKDVMLLCYHDGDLPTCPALPPNSTLTSFDGVLPENLLRHPSFVDGWNVNSHRDGKDLEIRNATFDGDALTALPDKQGTSAYVYNYRDHAPMQPNTTYTVKLWARTTAANVSVRVFTCTCCTHNRKVGAYSSPYQDALRTDWVQFVFVFLNPPGSECQQVSFHYKGMGGTDRLWLTAPTMVEGNSTGRDDDTELNLLTQTNFTDPKSGWYATLYPVETYSDGMADYKYWIYVENVTKDEIDGPNAAGAGFDVVGVSTNLNEVRLLQRVPEGKAFKPLVAGGSYRFGMQVQVPAGSDSDGLSVTSVTIVVCGIASKYFTINASAGWVDTQFELTLPSAGGCRHVHANDMMIIYAYGVGSSVTLRRPILQRIVDIHCLPTTTTSATTTTIVSSRCAAADFVLSSGDDGSCPCDLFCASNWHGNVKRQRSSWSGSTSLYGGESGPTCTCVEATHWCEADVAKGCDNSCDGPKGIPTALCKLESSSSSTNVAKIAPDATKTTTIVSSTTTVTTSDAATGTPPPKERVDAPSTTTIGHTAGTNTSEQASLGTQDDDAGEQQVKSSSVTALVVGIIFGLLLVGAVIAYVVTRRRNNNTETDHARTEFVRREKDRNTMVMEDNPLAIARMASRPSKTAHANQTDIPAVYNNAAFDPGAGTEGRDAVVGVAAGADEYLSVSVVDAVGTDGGAADDVAGPPTGDSTLYAPPAWAPPPQHFPAYYSSVAGVSGSAADYATSNEVQGDAAYSSIDGDAGALVAGYASPTGVQGDAAYSEVGGGEGAFAAGYAAPNKVASQYNSIPTLEIPTPYSMGPQQTNNDLYVAVAVVLLSAHTPINGYHLQII
jgi:hypothetical protein